MAKLFNQKDVLFKIEATEGTDAVPTAATNAFRTLNYAPNFMDAEFRTRAIDKAYMGAVPVVPAAFKRGATFEVEMSGSGAATTVPAWMVLNQAAGFAAGVPGGSSVVQAGAQNPVSLSHYAVFLDELNAATSFIMQAAGGKINMGYKVTDQDFPTFTYTYLGIPPTILGVEGNFTQPTYAAQAAPVLASSANTTFTLDGFALPLRSITMSANAQLDLRSLIGPAPRIAYLDDSWSGTIVAELPSLASKDYFAKIRPGTTMVQQLIHGTLAGNIVQVDNPAVQITGNVSLSNEQNRVMISMPVTLLPVNGNDEITFTSK